MTALQTRLAKLETSRGADEIERYVRSLTDEELEAQITDLSARLRSELEGRGVECAGLTAKQLAALEGDLG